MAVALVLQMLPALALLMRLPLLLPLLQL